ncbi:MAG: aquaporin family protein [Gammaproteobacteria bacterium]|nr:aquaporin family protein [Gammaproteobacteria bacterium]
MTNLTGEFLGTLVLVVFGGGVVANVLLKQSKGYHAGWLTVATGWFIAVTMGVFVAQSAGAPNADINPAISLAKYCLGIAYNYPQLLITIIAQIAGGFTGAVIVWLAYLPHWRVTDDPIDKLSVFCTVPAIRHYPSNTLTEVIGTTMLVIGVGAIFGHATSHHPASGLGPYLIGVLVWGIGISLGGPTGYAINPARDLGPRLAHALLPIAGKGSSDWAYAWVPIVGPLLGALLGAIIWHTIFH